MLFRGASAMLRHQDPSAIEQKVDLDNHLRLRCLYEEVKQASVQQVLNWAA